MNTTELKPCPFCGSTDLYCPEFHNERGCVLCCNCGVEGPSYDPDCEDAIEAWNRRAGGEQ